MASSAYRRYYYYASIASTNNILLLLMISTVQNNAHEPVLRRSSSLPFGLSIERAEVTTNVAGDRNNAQHTTSLGEWAWTSRGSFDEGSLYSHDAEAQPDSSGSARPPPTIHCLNSIASLAMGGQSESWAFGSSRRLHHNWSIFTLNRVEWEHAEFAGSTGIRWRKNNRDSNYFSASSWARKWSAPIACATSGPGWISQSLQEKAIIDWHINIFRDEQSCGISKTNRTDKE